MPGPWNLGPRPIFASTRYATLGQLLPGPRPQSPRLRNKGWDREIHEVAFSFMSLSLCVWLNGGRIAASQLDATTLFPNPGWLHWGAQPWAENGWPIAFPRSPCQNPSHLLWDIWGQCFPNFFCSSLILFKIRKEFKRLLVMCGQKPWQLLTGVWVSAAWKMEESQKVVQRAVALVGEEGRDIVAFPWPALHLKLTSLPTLTSHPCLTSSPTVPS